MDAVQRVVGRYRVRTVCRSAAGAPGNIDSMLVAINRYRDELASTGDTLDALVKAGEARRLGRVGPVKITDVKYDGKRITADVQGTTGAYQTRITLQPRGHHCTCPDWQQNGTRVGPCKHVLALGFDWKEQRLEPALDRLESGLMSILEHSEV